MTTLIDARIARAVARRVAGDEHLTGSYLMERLARDLEEAVPRAEHLVAESSGIRAPAPVRWDVIDRATWAEANITGMASLIRPLAEKVGARLDALPLPARLAQRALVSTEVGVLLGYISRRVLGQYDLLVPEEGSDVSHARGRGGTRVGRNGAALYFVGPNIVETERRFGFVPADFAFWVALHEVTHRFQFAGVPWLRERFFGLVNEYLSSMDVDARSLVGRLGSAVARLASRTTPPEERNPMYLLASEEQRVVLDRIQALMAVVEGHGNYVMDSVGARHIASFRRMRHVFERRRQQTSAVQRAINHAIGLEMKLRQYELGQRFCEHVVDQGGPRALARLWDEPECFPALAELREPQQWMRRVA